MPPRTEHKLDNVFQSTVLLLQSCFACSVGGKGSRGTSQRHTISEISLIPEKQMKDLASEVAKKSVSHLRSVIGRVQYP